MIFDAHGDIWTDVTKKRENGEIDVIKTHHLKNFKKGDIGGGIFVMWVDPPYYNSPKKRVMDMIQHISIEINENKDILHIVTTSEDFKIAKQNKKLAVVIGMEGLQAIEDNIDLLHVLYRFGVRHASLTWNEQNKLAAGAPIDNGKGLTEEGANVIRLMEQLGMVVDVSHANDKTFWDICEVATKPFIASHSNCKALCDVARNLSDDQLREIAKRNGVVGINTFKKFVDTEESNQTVERLVDHIDHMVKVMGSNHVGFGFDFYEYLEVDTGSYEMTSPGFGAKGIENMTKTKNLIDAMKKRGYSSRQIEKISYKNFHRVMKEILK